MRKCSVLVMVMMFVTGVVFASIIATQGELKIAGIIRNIGIACARADSNLNSRYTEAKNYVLAHPTQFDTSDKTKLSGLEAKIISTRAAIDELSVYINTEFPGLVE